MSRSPAARSVASFRDMPSTVTGASMQFCSAVMCGKRLKDWKTMPILARMRRIWAGVAGTSWPPCCMWVSGSPSTQMTPSLIDLERHQHPEHGGLARARWADDRHLLAAGDVEAEIVEDGEGAVALGDVVEADHGGGVAHRVGLRLR